MDDLLQALRRLAGSAAAAALAGPQADATLAAALALEGAALADAIAEPLAATLPNTLEADPRNDIDRAIRSVRSAAAAYVAAFHKGSATLIGASR